MGKGSDAPNRRGSPEAIAKRRAARAFNDVYTGRAGRVLDGRTEKRRQRLLRELKSGKKTGSGKPLKPIDVLTNANELLELGETLTNLRKVTKLQKAAPGADLDGVLEEVHDAYAFRPEAYKVLGISDETLERAGIPSDGAPAKARKRTRR